MEMWGHLGTKLGLRLQGVQWTQDPPVEGEQRAQEMGRQHNNVHCYVLKGRHQALSILTLLSTTHSCSLTPAVPGLGSNPLPPPRCPALPAVRAAAAVTAVAARERC